MTVRQVEQLRALLQRLALPATGQVRFIPDDCGRMGQLASTLRGRRQGLPAGLKATLSPGQEQVLLELERQLARACKEPASPLWTDTTMRQSEGLWQACWLAGKRWCCSVGLWRFLRASSPGCSHQPAWPER